MTDVDRARDAVYAAYPPGSRVADLGRGHDGWVFRAVIPNGSRFVVKVLSAYGMKYLPLTWILAAEVDCSPSLSPLLSTRPNLYAYAHELLEHVDPRDASAMKMCLRQICTLEEALLSRGLLLWDLGFSNRNYMLNSDGVLRWVDYGGNSVLLARGRAAPHIDGALPNLVRMNNDFIRLQILMHVAHWTRKGDYRADAWAAQKGSDRFTALWCGLGKALQSTAYRGFMEAVREANLSTPGGWEMLRGALK